MTKMYSTIALLLLTVTAFSQQKRLIKATTSGSWNSAATWTTTGSPATPGDNDSIVIAAGVNVTIPSTFTVTNCVLDIFGTLTFNEPNGNSARDLNIVTNTTLPVAVIRIAGSGSIVRGTAGTNNGRGRLIVIIGASNGPAQVKYSSKPGVDVVQTEVQPGQTMGPTINGPAFAQNTNSEPRFFITGSAASLPVKIGLFNATSAGTSVSINWTSIEEINSQVYIVEKSTNNINWQEIGTVAAVGNATMATKYQFTDDKPAEVNYYRLKMIDIDGRVRYSGTLVMRSQTRGANISLFPNPAVNSVNISIGQNLVKQGFTIHVLNHNGQVVSVRQIAEGVSALAFDVSRLQTGTYTMNIQFTGGVRESHKLVVVR